MAAELPETITVFIKLLSGELQWLLRPRQIDQLSISRLVDDEFVPLHLTSNQPLLPQPEEIFTVLINTSTYTVKIKLASTEVWEDNHTRYELYDFTLTEHDGYYRSTTQGIYVLPMNADTTPENISFFLECDEIPAQRLGRFGDEWDIEIPHDMVPLRGIRQLIEHSPLGKDLSDSTKEQIIQRFSEAFTKQLDIEFQRDEHELEHQAWMEEQAQRDL